MRRAITVHLSTGLLRDGLTFGQLITSTVYADHCGRGTCEETCC